MKKSLLSLFALIAASQFASAYASCEVGLMSGSSVIQVFRDVECSEALKDCRRSSHGQGLQCQILSQNQGPIGNGSHFPPQAPQGRSLVELTRMRQVLGCELRPSRYSREEELLIGGILVGVFDPLREERLIEREIQIAIQYGECRVRSQGGHIPQVDIVREAETGGLQYCHVKQLGHRKKLFVAGRIAGEFMPGQEHLLRRRLIQLTQSGQCVRRNGGIIIGGVDPYGPVIW